jgi:predicted N-acetyltransferase YhbS
MSFHLSPDAFAASAITLAPVAGVRLRAEEPRDVAARDALLDAAFGPQRFLKTCERLREGRRPAIALVAEDASGRIVGTVRLWHVSAGPGRGALVLGPLAVDASMRCAGLGGRLVRAALGLARSDGHKAILLVGDAPYYERFGFSAALTSNLWLPGPVERERFLALELAPGALFGARGLVSPTGDAEPRPDLAALVAGLMAANDEGVASRAA